MATPFFHWLNKEGTMKEMRFPVTFMDVETLANRWKCGISTIKMLAETEQIKLCIRPVALEIALEQFQIDSRLFQALCNTTLDRRDIYRLFHDRRTQIRISNKDASTENVICVDFNDMVISIDCVEAFEDRHRPIYKQNGSFELLSNDFTSFLWNGREYTFGPMQAKVIRRLWQAREAGEPWVYGKHLLSGVGSNSVRLRSLFSRNHNWRKLIISDKKGKYKLNLPPKVISA